MYHRLKDSKGDDILKKAVHFGAGSIGRGFIGLELFQAGYHVTFVDISKTIVDEMNARKQYTVEIVGDKSKKILVENISAINSNENPDALVQEIVDADIITTAVGSNALKYIAPNIAKGLSKRVESNQNPLNIIAGENRVDNSSELRRLIFENLDKSTQEKIDQLVGFPNDSVDRIVPAQNHPEDPLLVRVESYAEWFIDSKAVVGDKKIFDDIDSVELVNNLEAYTERKLFTINTGHASIAYVAYQKGIKDMFEAARDDDVIDIIWNVWKETGTVLLEKYKFDELDYGRYVETTAKRFANTHLADEVTRVARGPIRKISPADRLVSPANQLIAMGKTPSALAKVISYVLKFDYDQDPEAVELQTFIKEHGIDEAITKFTGAEKNSKLFELIKSAM